MLAVIDYGAGNLRSVVHALKHLGVEDMRLVREPADLNKPGKMILPGVGAFGAGMQQLRRQKLVDPIQEHIQAGVPYLGICLGMQFLFEHSEEMGNHEGFGILPGTVKRFPAFADRKVPHMGWNRLKILQPSPIFENLQPDSYAYFVHSYYCAPADPASVIAVVDYGIEFTAAIQQSHIFGVQFHPEKSQQTGLQILANFLKIQMESAYL